MTGKYEIKQRSGLKIPKRWAAPGAAAKTKTKCDKYDSQIAKASELYGVPAGIIKAFMMVESDGNPNVSSRAKFDGNGLTAINGLMQFNYTYVDATIRTEFKQDRVTEDQKSFFKKKGYVMSSEKGLSPSFKRSDSFDPEMNTVVGAMFLSRLLDSITSNARGSWAVDSNGTVRIDRVIVCYNGGAFTSAGKYARNITAGSLSFIELRGKVPVETRNYIDLMYAPNGALEQTGIL